MQKSMISLEFHVILGQLSDLALSERAKSRLRKLTPYLSETECARHIWETTDARALIERLGSPPLAPMRELDELLTLCEKGSMLTPAQLLYVAQFLVSCRRMKSYLKRGEGAQSDIAGYGASFHDLRELSDEIEQTIQGEQINDNASPELRNLRRRKEAAHTAIKARLDSLLRNNKDWFAESFISTRNGRFTLPVKREHKNKVAGSVVDMSGTGSTVFIEPTSVVKMQQEVTTLEIAEENEVRRILYTLTALVDEHLPKIRRNVEAMELLDFAFAKAKLSLGMKAVPATVTTERRIVLRAARHPLLPTNACVPLDFELGGDVSGVVITGPNTGGKTVALKTVGLLSLMAQCGLHVPAQQGSVLGIHNLILCDIGDGQSISENLSTFSSHIVRIIEVLRHCTHESLVLLDELGSGTDPAEGMGIAVAVLEELRKRGCLFVVTTHYPEIKDYAKRAQGLINARMAFDREKLCPLYRLQLGEAGESCALYIAKRLGFPAHLLDMAEQVVYAGHSPTAVTLPDEIGREVALPAQKNSAIQKAKPVPEKQTELTQKFQMGDCVQISPTNEIGIVYRPADGMGMVVVQVQGKKRLVPHKRLTCIAPAEQMYPPDYDFSIVFDTVQNRKARHVMEKRHDPDAVIRYESEE